MNARVGIIVAGCLLTVTAGATFAQHVESADTVASSDMPSQIPMFSYRDGLKSDLFLRSTPIGGLAEGTARVKYEDGHAKISAKVDKLPAPGSLGPYAVYVLWALTPEGRAVKQGVIAGFSGGNGKTEAQYGGSQFALIVTAEPHFAVTGPSTMIVLYNVAGDAKGQESKVTTLTGRADYSSLPRLPYDRPSSPELAQARYAVAIARQAGAARFAGAAYSTAKGKLADAEMALEGQHHAKHRSAMLAREAVVAAEDARRTAIVASAASRGETAATAAAVADADLERRSARTATAAAAWTELRDRLNTALPTRETARGLVADVGGLEFAIGTATLSASARASVAKFSRLVAFYPGLRFSVEGLTDSAGGAAANKDLSLRRAITVRDYLIGQGVPASSIDVAGLGSSLPTADHETADWRARARRVEIVVSSGPLAAN